MPTGAYQPAPVQRNLTLSQALALIEAAGPQYRLQIAPHYTEPEYILVGLASVPAARDLAERLGQLDALATLEWRYANSAETLGSGESLGSVRLQGLAPGEYIERFRASIVYLVDAAHPAKRALKEHNDMAMRWYMQMQMASSTTGVLALPDVATERLVLEPVPAGVLDELEASAFAGQDSTVPLVRYMSVAGVHVVRPLGDDAERQADGLAAARAFCPLCGCIHPPEWYDLDPKAHPDTSPPDSVTLSSIRACMEHLAHIADWHRANANGSRPKALRQMQRQALVLLAWALELVGPVTGTPWPQGGHYEMMRSNLDDIVACAHRIQRLHAQP